MRVTGVGEQARAVVAGGGGVPADDVKAVHVVRLGGPGGGQDGALVEQRVESGRFAGPDQADPDAGGPLGLMAGLEVGDLLFVGEQRHESEPLQGEGAAVWRAKS